MAFLLKKDMSKHLSEVSKFLSYVLRHQPDAIGITLDVEGWTEISALIAAAGNCAKQIDHELILAVVTTSDKKRFAISEDGLRIRAVQGHSTASVDINYVAKVPSEFLNHGTASGLAFDSRFMGRLSQIFVAILRHVMAPVAHDFVRTDTRPAHGSRPRSRPASIPHPGTWSRGAILLLSGHRQQHLI
jgi:RNA:NAD 2'-phosphotransferase (TPT1/KptA family)